MEQANETNAGDSRPIRTRAQGGQASGDPSARQVINDLSSSVWAFSALACALEAGLLEALSESRSLADLSHRSGVAAPLVEGVLDVLVSLGLLLRAGDVYSSTPDLLPLLQSPARDALLADIRTVYLQSHEMIDAAKRRTLMAGWNYTNPELLEAQGASGGPLFPTLFAVGLEPQDAPMAEARRNVTAARLGDRIELRAQGIEDLDDKEAFDLVWLPQVFLPREVLEHGLRRAWAALRPGGWILLIAFSTPGMDLDAALFRLANVALGGDPLYPEQVAELLAAADFARTQVLPGPPGSIPKLIVGQRPAA